MDTLLSDIERYAQVAVQGAMQHGKLTSVKPSLWLPTHSWNSSLAMDAQILERAIIRTVHFYNRINQTILYLLREFERTQGYRDLGYPSLADWAFAKLTQLRTHDQISRLCAVTTKVIAALDASPETNPETGEKITGLALILHAKPSALIRTAGAFAASDNGERQRIVGKWMSGTSDDRIIKGQDWQPKFGKAQATKHYDNEFVTYSIRASRSQEAVIDKNIGWMLEVSLE